MAILINLIRTMILSVAGLILFLVGSCLPVSAQLIIHIDPAKVSQKSSHIVATLADAVASIPTLRRSGHNAIIIEFAPGVHRLLSPVTINEEIAGRPGASLILRGPQNGSARISGSAPMLQIKHPIPVGAPTIRRGSILAFALPRAAAIEPSIEVERVHSKIASPIGLEIFDADGALTPARWPNAGWAALKILSNIGADSAIRVDPAQSNAWSNETDLWLSGYLGKEWSFEQLPAIALKGGTGTLLLGDKPAYGLRPDGRFYISHALAELDQAGEWWRDPSAGIVYLIPRRTGDNTFEVSLAENLLQITGAHNVRIENLILERVRGDAVVVENSRDIVLENCIIRWTGIRGVVFEKSLRSGVRRSLIADTGEGGILLDGGDRTTLTPSLNFAENNRIVRFSRLGRTEKYGVRLEGVGGQVKGNFIAHAQHIAIGFNGNNHLIEMNELTNVVNETSDAGAIYTGRDITARGTIIRNNFIHDLRPKPGFETKGIYLDDRASGVRVEGNLFLRVPQPVFIGGGRDNIILANLFLESDPAVFIDGRGVSWPLKPGGPPAVLSPESDEQRDLRSMPIRSSVWRTQYPELMTFNEDEPAYAKRNVVRDNITLDSTLLQIDTDADIGRQRVYGNKTFESLGVITGSSAKWHQAIDLFGLPNLPNIPLSQLDRNTSPDVPADEPDQDSTSKIQMRSGP